ncbi:MAG: SDR family oxidoreductase [Candidatus Hodarchaeales archaeon]|jgi:NAD(P)-dependent dehydrogenase (short-subunit alcohol dehydrogenase family)
MRTLFDLDNKVVIIFGGNGYLGQHLCRAIVEYGAKVYCCDINITKSPETDALKEKFPNSFKMLKVNASVKSELEELKSTILSQEKTIDVIVNAATMKGNDFYLPFEEVSLDGWEIGLLGNLTIPFLTIQTFIPIMKKQKEGSIINISSHYGLVGNDQRIYIGSNLHELYVKNSPSITRIYSHGVYNAAKGGLINFTRYLAAYYGEYNIRVNCISPGGVYYENENEAFLKKYSEKVPLGRKANPDEINGAVIFLSSDASSYITGHNLVVDGGYTIW